MPSAGLPLSLAAFPLASNWLWSNSTYRFTKGPAARNKEQIPESYYQPEDPDPSNRAVTYCLSSANSPPGCGSPSATIRLRPDPWSIAGPDWMARKIPGMDWCNCFLHKIHAPWSDRLTGARLINHPGIPAFASAEAIGCAWSRSSAKHDDYIVNRFCFGCMAISSAISPTNSGLENPGSQLVEKTYQGTGRTSFFCIDRVHSAQAHTLWAGSGVTDQ